MDNPDNTNANAERLKRLNPPKTGTCRICGAPRHNSIRAGSSIVVVTCDDCRWTMGKKSRKQPTKPTSSWFDEPASLPRLTGGQGQGKTHTAPAVVSMTGEKGVGKSHTASARVLGMDEAFPLIEATRAAHEPLFLRSYSSR